jgi:hypothetical protein
MRDSGAGVALRERSSRRTDGRKCEVWGYRSAHAGRAIPAPNTLRRVPMPLSLPREAPVLLIRRAEFERVGIERQALDRQFNLTPDEFRVEGDLIAVGPLFGDDTLVAMVEALEAAGLRYFDDFFELSGNWPEWLRVFATTTEVR